MPRYGGGPPSRRRVSVIASCASMMSGMRTSHGRLLRSDAEIDELLARTRSVAVVGVSSDSKRPSRRVAAYLIGATDWRVYLVNPNLDTALGRDVYPSLADLPEPPDIVDTFRRIEHLPAVAEAAIAAGAGALWFQLGLVDDEAAARATAAGLDVVQDHCLRVELYRWQHAGQRQ